MSDEAPVRFLDRGAAPDLMQVKLREDSIQSNVSLMPELKMTLLRVVRNLDNATDVRHAAARALGAIGDAASVPEVRRLAAEYPEVSTRRTLLEACQGIEQKHVQAGRRRSVASLSSQAADKRGAGP